MQALPGAALGDVSAWRAIANLLLVASGAQVRKRLTRNEGFPTSASDAKLLDLNVGDLKARKQRMLEILLRLADFPLWLELLHEARSLPDARYREQDWALLEQLLGAMPKLQLELQAVFAEQGAVDFVEMAERARRSLGTADQPTDLQLAMDLHIQHILIDEFQDTSRSQFALFEQLVAGWEPGDGRSIFAVGDPMQSIYRFRDADVGLFAIAQECGIADVQLTPLQLSVNFRASPALVSWVNKTFASVFPQTADADSGAVPYAFSDAHLEGSGEVYIHPFIEVGARTANSVSDQGAITGGPTECGPTARGPTEPQQVALLAEQAIADDPEHSVAILVRSRTQAKAIFHALQEHGVRYQAVDMDLLGERLVVSDLLSLCLALRYPHDRLHWLAILRAPWCGLTLRDLHVLMNNSDQQAVFDLLHQAERVANLSTDGQQRLDRFLKIIAPAVQRAPRAALVPWVEACWLQLGGPAVCRDSVDLAAAERCLGQLQTLETTGQLWQPSVLHNAMQTLYAIATDAEPVQVQVMTLHKAKGLEFDTVIVPSLDRQPRSDQKQLVDWFESTLNGQAHLLLAPFTERDAIRGPINKLVTQARRRCEEQEKLRLLYVACTRAKQFLHLLGTVKLNQKGELNTPHSQSLLHVLWPLLKTEFEQINVAAESTPDQLVLELATDIPAVAGASGADSPSVQPDAGQPNAARPDAARPNAARNSPQLLRLSRDWQMPVFSTFEWDTARQDVAPAAVEFQWASSTARDIGTVVHRQLQRMASRPEALQAESIAAVRPIIRRQLSNVGIPAAQLDAATRQVMRALNNMAGDARAHWIFDPTHRHARAEWALTAVTDAGLQRIVIDRTFIDSAGVRWIIDFKTGDHRGDIESFLDREQTRYANQLGRYADIMARMEKNPIKLGLYFPLLNGWREFAPAGSDQ